MKYIIFSSSRAPERGHRDPVKLRSSFLNSEAKENIYILVAAPQQNWIATSLTLLAMTTFGCLDSYNIAPYPKPIKVDFSLMG